MHCWLPIVMVFAAAAPQLRITTINGEVINGEVRQLGDQGLVIDVEGKRQHFSFQDLLAVRHTGSAESAAEAIATSASAEITDGTVIPLSDFRAEDRLARLVLDRAVFAEAAHTAGRLTGRIEIPTSLLTAVHLLPPSTDIRDQWQEIRELDLPSDVLIVRKRGSTAVDFLEGVVGDVTDEVVFFELEGDLLKIKRAKVDGFLYFRRPDDDLSAQLCRVRGASGLDAAARHVVLDEGRLAITTLSDVKLVWPFRDIAELDFSVGKLVFLSDLAPLEASWHPKIGLPGAANAVQKFNHPKSDASFSGTKLGLLWPRGQGAAMTRSTERQYDKGLAIRRRQPTTASDRVGRCRPSSLAHRSRLW